MYLRSRKKGSIARAKLMKEGGVRSKVGVLDSGQIMLGFIGHAKGSGFLDVVESCLKILNESMA